MSNNKKCKVFHSKIWGLREKKYDWLLENDIKTTKWQKLSPKSEFYLFIPRDERLLKDYEKYPKITEIFPINSVGIVTARDNFAIDTNENALKRRIEQFRDKHFSDEFIKEAYGLNDTSKFKLSGARKNVMQDDNWENAIAKLLYRPFDVRWIFYDDSLIERSRKEVMQHMMQENLGLLTCRQQNKVGFYHALICDKIVESCVVSNKTREINYLFPLYLYPDSDKKDLFSRGVLQYAPTKRQPNINPKVFATLTEVYKKEPTPEGIFYYIYTVFYSNIYRTKYAEFLKIDFPRIPFTRDYKLFSKMAEYGKELVDLHLMKFVGAIHVEHPARGGELPLHKTPPHELPLQAKFQGSGDGSVEKIKYEKGKVYINKNQYFEDIEKEVWEYQIGGYQVLSRWLKDRKKRKLSLEDIKHYCKVVTVLDRTIQIQSSIDELYPQIEKSS